MQSTCSGWGDGMDARKSLLNFTGEVIPADEHLRAATAKAAEWHDFSAKLNPIYIKIVLPEEHAVPFFFYTFHILANFVL